MHTPHVGCAPALRVCVWLFKIVILCGWFGHSTHQSRKSLSSASRTVLVCGDLQYCLIRAYPAPVAAVVPAPSSVSTSYLALLIVNSVQEQQYTVQYKYTVVVRVLIVAYILVFNSIHRVAPHSIKTVSSQTWHKKHLQLVLK